MNPPFSSTGGRVKRNRNKFGFRHVESALRRLAHGGRFAVILGESGAPRTRAGRVFWDSLLPYIRVNGSIDLPGREYYRNGTTVGVTLILGRKLTPDERESEAVTSDIPSITASSVADAFDRALAAGLHFQPSTQIHTRIDVIHSRRNDGWHRCAFFCLAGRGDLQR